MFTMKNQDANDDTTPVDQSPEKDKEKIQKKIRKGKILDKETVAADLDVGIDIEGKYFDPVDASMNLDGYETLSNEDIQKMIELHRQTNKKKLVLRVTRKTIKISFVDESVQDIEIPHVEIPKLWAPAHRGKLVLSIARRVDSKFRIYFVQLEKSKGETFLLKLQLSYKEYLVEGNGETKTEVGDYADFSATEKNSLGATDSTDVVVSPETEKEPEKQTSNTDNIPAAVEASVPTESPSSNLLDFDTETEANSASGINFDSLLVSTDAVTTKSAPDPKNAIMDLFATNGSSANSNTAWANFDANPIQEIRPTNVPVAGLNPPVLAPPPGRISPNSQRRAVSPNTATVSPTTDPFNSGSQIQSSVTPLTSVFNTNTLFVQPPAAPARSASPAFLSNSQPSFTSVGSNNPFVQPPPVSYGSPFEMSSMEAAFKELRNPPQTSTSSVSPVPMLQPQVITETKKPENPFETPEPQKSAEISNVEVKTAFGDLLDGFGFKPQTSQLATPKEMFAARDRKEKGPSLNDLGRN